MVELNKKERGKSRGAAIFHGEIDQPNVTGIGETLSFGIPANGWEPNFALGFPVLLKVEEIIHPNNCSEAPVIILFEAMMLDSYSIIKDIKKYFKRGFGLKVEKF